MRMHTLLLRMMGFMTLLSGGVVGAQLTHTFVSWVVWQKAHKGRGAEGASSHAHTRACRAPSVSTIGMELLRESQQRAGCCPADVTFLMEVPKKGSIVGICGQVNVLVEHPHSPASISAGVTKFSVAPLSVLADRRASALPLFFVRRSSKK